MITRKLRVHRFESPSELLRDNALGTAISHLPDAMRWVMILGGKGGLTDGEIASLTGVSPKVVNSTHNRGLTLVQRELLSTVRAAT